MPTQSYSLSILKQTFGRAATVNVAASDAPARVKAQADYVCDGTADEVEIQAAYDALPSISYESISYKVGKIGFSVGTYNLAASVTIGGASTPFVIELEGIHRTGGAVEAFAMPVQFIGDNITLFDVVYPTTDSQSSLTVRGLGFELDTKADTSGIGIKISNLALCLTVEGCCFEDAAKGIQVVNGLQWGNIRDTNFAVCTRGLDFADGASYGIYRSTFQNVSLYKCDIGAIFDSPNFTIERLTFLGCNIERNERGVVLTRFNNVKFLDTDFENNGTVSGSVGGEITLQDFTGASTDVHSHNLLIEGGTVSGWSQANNIPFVLLEADYTKIWGFNMKNVFVNRPGAGGTIPNLIKADDETPWANGRNQIYGAVFENTSVVALKANMIHGVVGGSYANRGGVKIINDLVRSGYDLTETHVDDDDNAITVFVAEEGLTTETVKSVTVNYNDASPKVLFKVRDGTMVTECWVEVTTTWNGTGANLQIGDGTDIDGYLCDTGGTKNDINLAATGYYGLNADGREAFLWDSVGAHTIHKIYTGADTIDATITPGTAASQGVAIVYVKMIRIGG